MAHGSFGAFPLRAQTTQKTDKPSALLLQNPHGSLFGFLNKRFSRKALPILKKKTKTEPKISTGCRLRFDRPLFDCAVMQLFALYMGSVSTVTTVKWLWFLINIGALGGVLVHLARIFKAGADAKGGEVAQLYGKVGWMTILVWSCYPIVWLFSEGFSSFSVSFEITMYAILDIVNKVVLCFMVMSAQDAIGSDDAVGNREYV